MDPLTALMQPAQPAQAPLDAWLLLSIFGAAVVAAGASIIAAQMLRVLRGRSVRALAPQADPALPLSRLTRSGSTRTEGVARRAA
ncbi:MAG: hypothetical protein J0L61_07450 [Planctomycetes bacterium]|nr:hypothetical protein [Planctomycetota bacterium]